MIEIKQINTKKEIANFIDFPHNLYQGDKNYVPEIFIGERDKLDPKKNPFWQHSKIAMFLAYRDAKIVGRIAAIRNDNYNEFAGTNLGFFGFFDCINDYQVAEELFNKASEWTKNEQLTGLMGPANPSTNDTCGVLLEGFDSPPQIMMTYNKPYYDEFLLKYGFKSKTDLLAYAFYTKEQPEKLTRLAGLVKNRLDRNGITVRKIDMKNFYSDVEKLMEVYNQAWEKNWGFVPMTRDEFMHLAKDLKMVVEPDYVLVAEREGKFIAFMMMLPNVNERQIKLKKGRLLPFGIFKLLFGKKYKTARILTLGVIEKYRKIGIDVYFYHQAFEKAKKNGVEMAEASWILADNEMMNKALVHIGGTPYKKYRMYEKEF